MIKKNKTYNDWLDVGRVVRKGEKSIEKNNKGEATFSVSQTDSVRVRVPPPIHKDECIFDDCYSQDFYPPTAFDIGADF